jgi:hypothetical protein
MNGGWGRSRVSENDKSIGFIFSGCFSDHPFPVEPSFNGALKLYIFVEVRSVDLIIGVTRFGFDFMGNGLVEILHQAESAMHRRNDGEVRDHRNTGHE